MIRKIIHIDSEKCNGCGLCAQACHEGAIGMLGGKAVLLRDDYCDGLGDCLPACPTSAISFVEREALAYDEAKVQAHMQKTNTFPCNCPGSAARAIEPDRGQQAEPCPLSAVPVSQLSQWPVQIKLVPAHAPFLEGAHLLVAADCTAYAYASFHEDFIKGKVTLIGCPKLDEDDYAAKLSEILRQNRIKSITVVRMQVPCCGGLESAVIRALQAHERLIPWQVVTISTDGRIVE